jgi:hypothetical protein
VQVARNFLLGVAGPGKFLMARGYGKFSWVDPGSGPGQRGLNLVPARGSQEPVRAGRLAPTGAEGGEE